MTVRIFLVVLIIFFSSCNLFGPEDDLRIRFEDSSCTEVWLRVEGNRDSDMTLYRDDKEVKTFYFRRDTTIIDEFLEPNTEYSYQIFGKNYDKSSNKVTAVTMDTTSHKFIFQRFTLGDGTGSSLLYDVAIINDTLAYSVGEIYQDYTKDYQIYNAAKWNGKTWELMRIPSRVCGSDEYCVRKLSTIFVFNQNDIWFSDGGEMIHWDGTSYTNDCSMNPWLTGAINKLWGSSSNDLYAVGNNGLIA
ncbi:MAG TPA: hypothetical protein P5268_07510, partial [Candidatus Marinimicrobia bacterium]|nr:hypothetical protein [Candidatus Neomarinimicrobiota bacterium]HRU92861.1 hypothetical protein [Candidatus Neomarinimicrobiota bacterium]